MFFCISCQKENQVEKLSGDWIVTALKMTDQFDYQESPKEYVVSFDEEKNMRLFKDVNLCSAIIDVGEDGDFSISSHHCTYACCDSEFADDILILISTTSSFHIRRNVLTLRGDGVLKLKR
jgi:hypothetical protein